MDINGLNNKVDKWAKSKGTMSRNWFFRFHNHLEKIDCDHFQNGNDNSLSHIISTGEERYFRTCIH